MNENYHQLKDMYARSDVEVASNSKKQNYSLQFSFTNAV